MSDIEADLSENEPETPRWVALPDPSEESFSGACWLCQVDDPGYTLEIIDDELGQGRSYKLCGDCVEKLVGQLEDTEPEEGI